MKQFFIWAASAQARGGVDGGGGKGVVCRDSAGVIQSAETLDLYEARVMFGLDIRKSNAPMKEQIHSALNVIPPTSRGLVSAFAERVQKNLKITPPGTQLLPIDDSHEVLLPQNCAVEQLANYYNDKLILISGDIWALLGETDRAALILHEAVYAANRVMGADNSKQSRHVVGHLFDPKTKWVDVRDQIPQSALTCASVGGGVFLWAYRDSNQNWILQFNVLGTGLVLSKKTILIQGQEFDFDEAKTFPLLPGEEKIGTGRTSMLTAQSDFEDGDFVQVTRRWEAIKDQDGKVIEGYQTPRYYLSWRSATFPTMSVQDRPLNCSVQVLPENR